MMKCKICGKMIDEKQEYVENVCSEKCFHEYYWTERIRISVGRIVVKGVVYQIGDENSTSSYRGFNGRPFYIKYLDGTVVKTTNLWHNGKVPQEYRDRLPDNAEFISEEEYNKIKEKQNV